GIRRRFARTSPPTASKPPAERQKKTPARGRGLPKATLVRAGSEGDAPAVDVAGVQAGVVAHPQLPGAVEVLAGQVHRVGLDDVVGAATGAVVQVVDRTVRRHQVDAQVADVGVTDVHGDLGVARRLAAAAGDGDRALDLAIVRDRVVGAVAVGLGTATAAGAVVADQADAGEARVGLHADVVGAGGGRGEAAGLRVAALVRTAVVAAVGRGAAVLDVQVGVTGATRDAEAQVAGAG